MEGTCAQQASNRTTGENTRVEVIAGASFDDSDDTSGGKCSIGRAHCHTVAASQAHLSPVETNAEARARPTKVSPLRLDSDLATDRRGALLARGHRFGAVFDEARHAEAVEATRAVLAAERRQRRCDS